VPRGVDPLHGVFARVGAIALNALLAAEPHLGETVAVFGQGVLGLLATRMAALSGTEVFAVDGLDHRLGLARLMGAVELVGADAPGGSGAAIRSLTSLGADAAIELSGSYRALHEAVRCVGPEGVVVAAGFYQGGAEHLRLGEEFHHNRIRIIASQIGATPVGLGPRWNHSRLVQVFMTQVATGAIDVAPLITDVIDAARVADAFALLDRGHAETLQVVLRFDAAPAAPAAGAA
jgi:threonine dehydrogenase-like Zn-dependent dehydrogenase